MIENQLTTGEAIYRELRLQLGTETKKQDLFNKMAEYILENTDWEDQISKSTKTLEDFIGYLKCCVSANRLKGTHNNWSEYKRPLFALAYMSLLGGDKVQLEKVIERLKSNSYTIVEKNHKESGGNGYTYPNDMLRFLIAGQDIQNILSKISRNEKPREGSAIESSDEDMMYYILKLLYEKETKLCEIYTEMEVDKLKKNKSLEHALILRLDVEELMKDWEEMEKETPMGILKPDETCMNLMAILVSLEGLLKESFDISVLEKYIKKPENI